jgi:hypothetical protein
MNASSPSRSARRLRNLVSIGWAALMLLCAGALVAQELSADKKAEAPAPAATTPAPAPR